MRQCTVCRKIYGKGNGILFRAPKQEEIRNTWSEICGKKLKETSRVCADHFLPSSFIRVGNQVNLLPNAEPICMHFTDINIESSSNTGITNLAPPVVSTALNAFSNILYVERKREQETQTDPSLFPIYAKELFDRLKILEAENKSLKKQLSEANATIEALGKVFTEGQIKKLTSAKRIQWMWQDISKAICLHASGPRAYTHLYKQGFPLPHVSTLQRWCATVEVKEGMLTSCINFMEQTTDLAAEDKVCILAFDEMKVAEAYEYDAVSDVVRKPANYVQVVMARGLRKSWKQPVFFDYDCKMSKTLLGDIIMKLCDIGFPVVAMVCDMGPTNRKLWKDLGVTTDKPWFPSPACTNEKVFCFCDVPHLLKLVRNHFLDSGLLVKNNLLTSKAITDLRSLTSKSDVTILFKITDDHVMVKGSGRQKVKLAAQLFSHTTASALRRCYSLGMAVYKPLETSDFFELINDWFDIHNAKLSTFKYPGKEPYGIALESQNCTLNKINDIMSTPIIPGKNSLEFFQKGILISNKSLVMLHKYVEKYNMTYLVTNRLNQDIVENFFSAIRSKGGLNDHPTPMDFKYRLRKYIMARNTEHLNGKTNTEDDATEWINTAENCRKPKGENKENILPDTDELLEEERELDDFYETNLEDIGILQEDALEYISGYIIKKQNLVEYECLEDSHSWVDQVSKLSLKKPKPTFLAQLKRLECIFASVNGNEISHCPKLKEKLLDLAKSVILPENVKKLFFKCRIYFRVRHLNQRLKIQKEKQRLLGHSKLIKMKL